MFQLKSRIISFWRRLDLVADDPGVERDWSHRRPRTSRLKFVGNETPTLVKASVPPRVAEPRTPVAS